MNVSVTLFESIVLLIISGVFVVFWWGVKRFIKINDDEAKHLYEINKSLAKICERLGKSDTWMLFHSKQDDERHEENKGILMELKNAIRERNK